jgi:23S rRNA (guanosine2251-2'-O)-methyltransferase
MRFIYFYSTIATRDLVGKDHKIRVKDQYIMNKSSFFIVGQHAVIEALRNPKRKVLRVFLTEESKKNIHRKNPKTNVLKDIKIHFKTKKELDKYVGNEQLLHQGYVAEIEHIENFSLKNFIKDNNNITFACLDGVTDPRNIGSIIRSAVSFNIDGLIVKERHFPSESKLLFKAASGSIEHINIFKVSNINSTLKFLREKNFWVYGFDSKAEKKLSDVAWEGNNVLLFGSEGYGMRKHTLKYSDFSVRIDINKKIESLNISNSASIIFHHLNYLKNVKNK